MNRAEYDQLTPMERNCLRLAHHERKTEHIAHELGIAASTVNTHIFSARRKLGGPSRLSAADQLRAYEAALQAPAPSAAGLEEMPSVAGVHTPSSRTPPQQMSRPALSMAEASDPATSPLTPTEVREERATFVFDEGHRSSGGRDRPRAAVSQHVITILAIALLTALVLIAAPAIYDSAAERIANSLERPNPK